MPRLRADAGCCAPSDNLSSQCCGDSPLRSTPVQRALQRAVKALYLALRLRMSDAAPMQRMPCFISHSAKSGGCRRRPGPTPPRHAVIHQHAPAAPRSSTRPVPAARAPARHAVLPSLPPAQSRNGCDHPAPIAGPPAGATTFGPLKSICHSSLGVARSKRLRCRTMPVLLLHQMHDAAGCDESCWPATESHLRPSNTRSLRAPQSG